MVEGLFFNLHQAVKCLYLCPGAPGLLSPWNLKALVHGRSESGWSFMPYSQGSHPFLPPGTMERAFSSLLPFFQSSLNTQRRSMEKTLRVDANSSFICGSQCFILSDCSHWVFSDLLDVLAACIVCRISFFCGLLQVSQVSRSFFQISGYLFSPVPSTVCWFKKSNNFAVYPTISC